ncbi:MAG: hypothetical protein ACOYMK_13200 [Hyphomonadaceae bacterium]
MNIAPTSAASDNPPVSGRLGPASAARAIKSATVERAIPRQPEIIRLPAPPAV